jgi:transposase
MAGRRRHVIGGVDTHGKTHHAAVIDRTGQVLGDQEFRATAAGYQQLLAWLNSFGRVSEVGIEGTGSYGAGLSRHLRGAGITVVEVDRPDRAARRRQGKSDPIDAISAARAVLSGRASAVPKLRTGPVEAVRVLQVTRRSAVKARTAALNQLRALIVTAPEPLRAHLAGLSPTALLATCADLPFDEDRLSDPAQATAAALRALAHRITALTTETTQATGRLGALVATTAPRLTALHGVGPEVAAQLLATAGDNPDRLHSEAALARLTGAAPLPASSGRTDRHRLSRSGDRQANKALYTIVLSRLRYDTRTHDYVDRRKQQGLTTKEIIRCLKRYIVREVYQALIADFKTLPAT